MDYSLSAMGQALPPLCRGLIVWSARLALIALCAALVTPMFAVGDFRLLWDKAEHFIIAYTAAMLLYLATPRLPALLCAALVVGAATGAELVQATLPHRSGTLGDWMASAVGALAAWAPMALLRLRRALS